MKKLLINIMLIISLIIPINVYALSTTEAQEKINLTKDCSLTLNYNYNSYDFSNVNVKIYYIASVTNNFQYELTSNFQKYPLKINGIKTVKQWNGLEQTLNAYIEADNIKETLLLSIQNNKIVTSNLKPGLYFIKTDKIDTENYTLLFDSFLISIPDLNEDGTWNYDINVYPKSEEYIPKYKKITYTLIKEWTDNEKERPDNIEVEIYKNGLLVENKILSKDNNWIYNWETEDDGSIWTVVERNIPNGYNVSISDEGTTFIIVNTDPDYEEKSPQTGDNINLYFYLLFGSIFGFVLLIISLFMYKKQVK